MRESRPITKDGHLIGVAASGDGGWFFIAVDPRLEDLHGARYPSAAELERVAHRVLARTTSGSLRVPAQPAQQAAAE